MVVGARSRPSAEQPLSTRGGRSPPPGGRRRGTVRGGPRSTSRREAEIAGDASDISGDRNPGRARAPPRRPRFRTRADGPPGNRLYLAVPIAQILDQPEGPGYASRPRRRADPGNVARQAAHPAPEPPQQYAERLAAGTAGRSDGSGSRRVGAARPDPVQHRPLPPRGDGGRVRRQGGHLVAELSRGCDGPSRRGGGRSPAVRGGRGGAGG